MYGALYLVGWPASGVDQLLATELNVGGLTLPVKIIRETCHIKRQSPIPVVTARNSAAGLS